MDAPSRYITGDATAIVTVTADRMGRATAWMRDILPKHAVQGMYRVLDYIGNEAATTHMIQNSMSSAGITVPSHQRTTDPTRLTWRSGRLARSLMGQGSGAQGMNPEGIKEVVQEGSQFVGRVGTRVLYAGVHERGGFIPGTPVTVTRHDPRGKEYTLRTVKMSLYFWAKFKETGDVFYKRMAISTHRKRGVQMKMRSFLGATIRDARTPGAINEIMAKSMMAMMREAFKSAAAGR